ALSKQWHILNKMEGTLNLHRAELQKAADARAEIRTKEALLTEAAVPIQAREAVKITEGRLKDLNDKRRKEQTLMDIAQRKHDSLIQKAMNLMTAPGGFPSPDRDLWQARIYRDRSEQAGAEAIRHGDNIKRIEKEIKQVSAQLNEQRAVTGLNPRINVAAVKGEIKDLEADIASAEKRAASIYKDLQNWRNALRLIELDYRKAIVDQLDEMSQGGLTQYLKDREAIGQRMSEIGEMIRAISEISSAGGYQIKTRMREETDKKFSRPQLVIETVEPSIRTDENIEAEIANLTRLSEETI
ncbi:MAG: hypothetical protein ACWGQW_03560, partial [bacterium]